MRPAACLQAGNYGVGVGDCADALQLCRSFAGCRVSMVQIRLRMVLPCFILGAAKNPLDSSPRPD